MEKRFSFFDFCSGIGAGHVALNKAGGKCVGYSEISDASEKTYLEINSVSDNVRNWGDLTKINRDLLPNFDLMIGGFPCQAFSIVGKRDGFKDGRGRIIFGLANILHTKKPKCFLLENVKGLVNHNKGSTFKSVLELLKNQGYNVYWKVLKSTEYGIPQIRERVYIVGVRKDIRSSNRHFEYPAPTQRIKTLSQCLIDNREMFVFNQNTKGWDTFLRQLNNRYNKGKLSLTNILKKDFMKKDFMILDTRQSDLRMYEKYAPTLRTGRHGILYVKDGNFRRLSGMESLLLQGFPLNLAKKVKKASHTELLSQAGNAFTVNVIESIAKEMKKTFVF